MGALITPILVLTFYLFFPRWPNWVVSAAADYSAVALASITGALWLLRLPVSAQARVAIVCAYLIVYSLCLYYYSFLYTGLVLDNWL